MCTRLYVYKLAVARNGERIGERLLAASALVAESFGMAERQGMTAEREMLYIGLETVNEYVAKASSLVEGVDVLSRRKKMMANGVPVRVATSYFRPDLFADTRIADPEFVRLPLQSALHDLGTVLAGQRSFWLRVRPRCLNVKRWSWRRRSGWFRCFVLATALRTRLSMRWKRCVLRLAMFSRWVK